MAIGRRFEKAAALQQAHHAECYMGQDVGDVGGRLDALKDVRAVVFEIGPGAVLKDFR
jgi:hypothetical protein